MRGPGAGSVLATRLNDVTAQDQEFGVVGYTHAGGVDRPPVVWKGAGASPTDVVVPHANWRGVFGKGTNSSGGTSTVAIEWPGFKTTAYHRMSPSQQPTTKWMGSLIGGHRDPGGTMYMRNRYYDPQTGQFTQTDPIGIAGGMNTYGFASGDPVGNWDPFGLCSWGIGPDAAFGRCGEHDGAVEQGGGCCREFFMRLGEIARGPSAHAVIREYGDRIHAAGERMGVDPGLIMAILFEEMVHTMPGEDFAEAIGIGSTIGLGQMTAGKHGYSRRDLMDPVQNINAVATHLRFIIAEDPINTDRLVGSWATMYNCNSCTSVSPYGTRVEGYYKRWFSNQR